MNDIVPSPESLPNPEMVGFVQNELGKPLLHYCHVCGAWAPFGHDMDFLAGTLGRWYYQAAPEERMKPGWAPIHMPQSHH